MKLRPLSSSPLWLLVSVLFLAYFGWSTSVRVETVAQITALGNDIVKTDATSPTGYAGGVRRLIIPGHSEASYRWIAQTQQMLAQKTWHVRHVDYDNAPLGHAVTTPSPYRWWLGLLAQLDHHVNGTSLGLAVERAAVWADPLVLLCVFVIIAGLLSWRVNPLAGALATGALTTLFPLVTDFLPGRPDSTSLLQGCILLSVILLLPGLNLPDFRLKTETAPSPTHWPWWLAGGFFGGLGLWINFHRELPVELGVFLSALGMIWLQRQTPASLKTRPFLTVWRAWAFGGSLAILVAFVLENSPDSFSAWPPRSVHPVQILAWLGAGELLTLAESYFSESAFRFTGTRIAHAVLAAVAILTLPAILWKWQLGGLLNRDALSMQLARIPESPSAESLSRWIFGNGFTPIVWATLLPLFVVPLLAIFAALKASTPLRAALVLPLVPLGIIGAISCWQLNNWDSVDACLVVGFVTIGIAVAEKPRGAAVALISLCFALIAFEAAIFIPAKRDAARAASIDQAQARELIERDLAHWLANQTGPAGAVILAPVNDTSALCYYGGLRGIATLDADNSDGLVAAVRIASATSTDEARELVEKRGITHFVIPSWDSQLDDFARAGIGQVDGSFIAVVDQWRLPTWLRPVAYQVPSINGEVTQSVAILNVVDDQEPAILASRLAEYLIEMKRPDLLPPVEESLRHFPGDVSAVVSLANVQQALGDEAGFEQTLKSLANRLQARNQRNLPLDRRVALATLLAQTKKFDQAEDQAKRCFHDANEARLRLLSTSGLYHLMVLGKGFHLQFSDPKAAQLALDLLPLDARRHFQEP